MKSSQETCCTETVIFGGKICTVRECYAVGILRQQSMCVFWCPVNHAIALRSGTGEVPFFVPAQRQVDLRL